MVSGIFVGGLEELGPCSPLPAPGGPRVVPGRGGTGFLGQLRGGLTRAFFFFYPCYRGGTRHLPLAQPRPPSRLAQSSRELCGGEFSGGAVAKINTRHRGIRPNGGGGGRQPYRDTPLAVCSCSRGSLHCRGRPGPLDGWAIGPTRIRLKGPGMGLPFPASGGCTAGPRAGSKRPGQWSPGDTFEK